MGDEKSIGQFTECAATPPMPFGEAIIHATNGRKIARRGWNGAKLGFKAFIVHQKGYPSGIPINANTSSALGIPEGTVCIFEPYLMLACPTNPEGGASSGPQYLCRPWTPDQRDQLATDWYVMTEPQTEE